MAAIDKIYVNTWEEYIQFKEWCEQQPPLLDKYGKSVKISEYLITSWSKENWKCHPIFSAPCYIDAYVIRNCPFDFIQEELMINYGHWSQERIKSFYEDVKNWNSEEKCPYWAKLEDFVFNEDGTITLKGLEKSDYDLIKEGKLYISPFTIYQYEIGKHIKCIKHPYIKYNRPFKGRWFVNITLPTESGYMWYHENHNSWDFSDEFVIADWSSSTAYVKTIKAAKRLMIKWKLPIGTKVTITGYFTNEIYEFLITK